VNAGLVPSCIALHDRAVRISEISLQGRFRTDRRSSRLAEKQTACQHGTRDRVEHRTVTISVRDVSGPGDCERDVASDAERKLISFCPYCGNAQIIGSRRLLPAICEVLKPRKQPIREARTPRAACSIWASGPGNMCVGGGARPTGRAGLNDRPFSARYRRGLIDEARQGAELIEKKPDAQRSRNVNVTAQGRADAEELCFKPDILHSNRKNAHNCVSATCSTQTKNITKPIAKPIRGINRLEDYQNLIVTE